MVAGSKTKVLRVHKRRVYNLVRVRGGWPSWQQRFRERYSLLHRLPTQTDVGAWLTLAHRQQHAGCTQHACWGRNFYRGVFFARQRPATAYPVRTYKAHKSISLFGRGLRGTDPSVCLKEVLWSVRSTFAVQKLKYQSSSLWNLGPRNKRVVEHIVM